MGGSARGVHGVVGKEEALRRHDFAKLALQRIDVSVGTAHMDADRAADANIDLANRIGEPLGSPPLRELTGIRPSPEDRRARRVEHARASNFTFSKGRSLCNTHHPPPTSLPHIPPAQ